jgi:amidase
VVDDLSRMDATAQADLVRTGEASPIELVDAAIAAIEKVNPELNAVIHERFEQARTEAEGPLPDGPFRGVPMVLKDLDGYQAGEPYHGGVRHLRDARYVPTADSYLTAKFRQAGFVFVGRTNTPELGLQPTTEPELYGPTRNPWDPTRSPGGSSGGSASAVASGMVPVGHAGDGGGSIRIPASACGLVGLKPSRGRNSLGPELGEAWGGNVARLVVSRTVRDTAGILDAVHGPMPGDPYVAPPPSGPYLQDVGADPGRLRIGFTWAAPDPTIETHAECVAAVQGAAEVLSSLGHDVGEGRPEVWDDEAAGAEFSAAFVNAFATWTANDLQSLEAMTGSPVTEQGVEAGTWAAAEIGRTITGAQYIAATTVFNRFTRRMASFWAEGHDLLLTPTLPEPPLLLGQMGAAPDNPLAGLFRSASVVPFVAPFNTTGQPAISLPLHWSADGLPIGVQLVAAPGREDLLIRVAAQLEQAAPWVDRVAPIHA